MGITEERITVVLKRILSERYQTNVKVKVKKVKENEKTQIKKEC